MKIFWIILILINIFQILLADGVFEVRILSYINELGLDAEGNCCEKSPKPSPLDISQRCSEKCRTFFRICLKHYQVKIDVDNSHCTFGQYITPVLISDNLKLSDSIKFDFNFSWPVSTPKFLFSFTFCFKILIVITLLSAILFIDSGSLAPRCNQHR